MVERRHGVAGNPHEQPRSRHAQHVSRGVPNAQETGAGQLEPAWARHLAQCVRCFADSFGCPPGARRRVVMRLPACTHCRRSTCAVGRSHQRCHARPTLRLLCRLHSRTTSLTRVLCPSFRSAQSELLYVELCLAAVRAFCSRLCLLCMVARSFSSWVFGRHLAAVTHLCVQTRTSSSLHFGSLLLFNLRLT